ncbi:MAG TPA: universal stress protein [Blastocatellia bacterium]|nr:universal stress protein [Blastocatellia bacterium]
MRIENILVPTDFSENAQAAFEKACDLARQLGAKLYLLHIQDGSALRVAIKEELLSADSTDEQLQVTVQQLIAERFSEMSAGIDRSQVSIECISRRGNPKAGIVHYAEEIDADMVVIGMRGITAMSMVTSAALGSVAEWVLRRSPCPTLIVRTEHRPNRAE